MKSLDELRKILSSIGTYFADEDSDVSDDFPDHEELADDVVTLEKGFPPKFSQNPKNNGGGLYLLRNSMNALGKIATDELLNSEIGVIHTYDSILVTETEGYPKNCILRYDDGKYIKLVESQTSKNDKNFITSKVIDRFPSTLDRKIYWKTVGQIYGLSNMRLSVSPDYSKKIAYVVAESNSLTYTATENCYVIIGNCYYGASSPVAGLINNITTTLSIGLNNNSIQMEHKGASGLEKGPDYLHLPSVAWFNGVAWVAYYGWLPISFPTLGIMAGSGNYNLSFFLRNGETVSVTYNQSLFGSPLELSAYALATTVEKEPENMTEGIL